MAKDLWTIGRILEWTTSYFADKGIESPRIDGELLLAYVLKKTVFICIPIMMNL